MEGAKGPLQISSSLPHFFPMPSFTFNTFGVARLLRRRRRFCRRSFGVIRRAAYRSWFDRRMKIVYHVPVLLYSNEERGAELSVRIYTDTKFGIQCVQKSL